MKQIFMGWLYRLWGWLPIPLLMRWMIIWLGTSKFLIGVAAVIINEKEEVLFFKHTYRGNEPWGLPGGWLQKREDPARAVEREICEESGLEVRVLYPVWTRSDDVRAHLDIIFFGRYLGGAFRPSPEVCEAAFFQLDELPAEVNSKLDIGQMVKTGKYLEERP